MAPPMPALKTPKCAICQTTFKDMEYLNTHMKAVHGESDHERLERITQILKSDENKKTNEKTSKVTFSEENNHNIKDHVISDNSEEDIDDNICELCDKVLPNKTQKSNHMLFQHTVRKDRLKCDYCGFMCTELMNLCKHISKEHSEKFAKKEMLENKCDMCYLQFDDKEKVTSHMSKMHSPESFYEKIVEDISGECRVCKKEVCYNETEDHFQKNRIKLSEYDNHTECVLQILLKVVDESVKKSIAKKTDLNFKFTGGDSENNKNEDDEGNLDTDDDNDEITGEESDQEINPVYEYNYSGKNERYVGNKPPFIEAVAELKKAFRKKDNNVMMINDNEITIKDYRIQKFGVEIDVEVKTKKQRGFSLIKIWGPSEAKKRCTLMVSKTKISEEKFATILSRKVIKPIIDYHIKGGDIKEKIANVFQNTDKVTCERCRKPVNKSYMKTHIQNQHPSCNICSENFLTKIALKEHTVNKHSSASIKIVKEVLKEERTNNDQSKPFEGNRYDCDICSFTAYSKKYLWMHKEKSHINDPTYEAMIGSKRDVTLVKTSSISEPFRKKKNIDKKSQEEVIELKNISNKMDQNILEKRRLEDEEEEKHKAEKDLPKTNFDISKKEDKAKITEKVQVIPSKEKESDKKQLLENKLRHPKLKRLPKAVECLNPNSIEFIAEGNGACCVNCLAMWLFLNETEMGLKQVET